MAESGIDGAALETSQLAATLEAVTRALRSLGVVRMVEKISNIAVKEHIKGQIEAMIEDDPNQRILKEVVQSTEIVPLQFLQLIGKTDPKVR